MEKITLTSLLLLTLLNAEAPSTILQKNCLACHTEQKIPSELIYRRYLMKYSTHENIKDKLMNYLKNPKTETSIMPKQFFLKFPMKEALDLNETVLEESIEVYLDYFDVRSRLVLP
jgi:cytochrome c551/c552